MCSRLFAFLALPVLASAGTIVQTGTLVDFHPRLVWPLDHFVSGQKLTHVEATFHVTYGWDVNLMFPEEPGMPLIPPVVVVTEGYARVGSLILPEHPGFRAELRCEFPVTVTTLGGDYYCGGQADFMVAGDPDWPEWSSNSDPLPFGWTYLEATAWCEPGNTEPACWADAFFHDGSAQADYSLTYTYVDPSVPEPGTGALVMASLGVLAIGAWRRGRGSR